MLNLYDTLLELETKGTLQEQAYSLYLEDKKYKNLIYKYRNNELLCNKYKIRLENVRNEMMYLNKRIVESLEVIEPFVDVEVFCELFGVDYEEYDEEENFYNNLLMSGNNYIGYVCRKGLLQNEKMVKDMIEDDEE